MLPTRILPLLLGIVALACLPACSFHKSITNERIKQLDAASIVVGKDSHLDVLEKLGPPAPVVATEKALKNVSARHFKYSCWETREAKIEFAFVLVLPFIWRDNRAIEELVVEFDDRGIVSDVYRVKGDCIWRPLQGEGSRDADLVELTGGGS
jgi:hypothetical protein